MFSEHSASARPYAMEFSLRLGLPPLGAQFVTLQRVLGLRVDGNFTERILCRAKLVVTVNSDVQGLRAAMVAVVGAVASGP